MMTPTAKTARRATIAKRVTVLRRSRKIRESWARRREQRDHYFAPRYDDESEPASETVGVDAELEELPEII